MIAHLIVIFGNEAENSPLANALRDGGLDLVVLSRAINTSYKHRARLLFVVWPRLFLFSLKTATKSLRSSKQADVIIVNSHFDVLALYAVSLLTKKKLPKIILPGFIYTQKGGRLHQQIKLRYYRWILKHADVVICHSENEVSRNKKIFKGCGCQFYFFPYAMQVNNATDFLSTTLNKHKVVAAGRSGRDYPTLIKALSKTSYETSIICDYSISDNLGSLPSNISILRNCYGDCYANELMSSRAVVVPLQSLEVSAGQMVLIQAMAYGKPVVVTRTKTSVHYIEHMKTGILVEPGDENAMEQAIIKLMTDDELCERLGKAAAKAYRDYFSIKAYANRLIKAIVKAG